VFLSQDSVRNNVQYVVLFRQLAWVGSHRALPETGEAVSTRLAHRTERRLSNATEVSCEKRDARRNEREQVTAIPDTDGQRALFGSFTGSVRPQGRQRH
jgi:hypothetical protein